MKQITSIFELDKTLLQEYGAFEKVNLDNWNILSYLNMKYDLNSALAFSKLYFPDFVEINGCLILEFRFNPLVFEQWFTKYEGDVLKTEFMCNYYDLADFFHINSGDESNFELGRKDWELAKILQASWKITCKAVFPDKDIKVEIVEREGTPSITLYQIQ